MSVRARWIAVGGLIVLIVVKLGLLAWDAGTEQVAKWSALANRNVVSTPVRTATPFTPAEITAFLAQAKQARSIADPLKRCLAFPDPPASHWSHDTVAAYCHYTTQPVISVAEITTLIQNGHADQVDKLFADAVQLQRTQPDSRGLVDYTYSKDFKDSSEEMRGILDAWKRQSPKSAFAYAASGTAYVISAHDARGSDVVGKTDASNFESMGRLLQFADDDLGKAIALDPKLTPAYAAMVEAGIYGDRRYGVIAASRGLAVDPSNYMIYMRLMRLSQPKWGGSIAQMQAVGAQALSHSSANPLLSLLPADAAGYLASGDDCDCGEINYVPDYRSVFDHASNAIPMGAAGQIASRFDRRQSGLGLVYAAEDLRFYPGDSDSRATLSFELTRHGEMQWAKEEGDRLVQDAPGDAESYKARGKAYEMLQDYPHATEDYNKAFALDPTEPWPLVQMGVFNIHKTHDWDKAWSDADELIKWFPDHPEAGFFASVFKKISHALGFTTRWSIFSPTSVTTPTSRPPCGK